MEIFQIYRFQPRETHIVNPRSQVIDFGKPVCYFDKNCFCANKISSQKMTPKAGPNSPLKLQHYSSSFQKSTFQGREDTQALIFFT